MAFIYGNTIASAWKAVAEYSVVETDTAVTITVTNCGLSCNPGWGVMGTWDDDSTATERMPLLTSLAPVLDIRRRYWYTSDINVLTLGSQAPFSITIAKTNRQQTKTLAYSITLSSWFRTNYSSPGDFAYFGPDTSTARININIPAIVKPVATLAVVRDTTTSSQAEVTAVVTSFANDTLTNVHLYKDNVIVPDLTWQIVTSGNTRTYRTTLTNLTDDSSILTFNITGLGGVSNMARAILGATFFTIDFYSGGSGVSFGSKAEHEGFSISMPPYIDLVSSDTTTGDAIRTKLNTLGWTDVLVYNNNEIDLKKLLKHFLDQL